MMYVLPFFWRLFRRNDQAIPRITTMTKSTVRDEINITQSGPLADRATVAKKKKRLIIIIKFGYNARCHWLKERAL